MTAKGDSYPLLDWLRFVLAVAVVLSHGGAIVWNEAGNFAVQVFFALSGWLIGGILVAGEIKNLPVSTSTGSPEFGRPTIAPLRRFTP
jgi:peptidoglycan/LPS O-acetylase OafA/YrhL